MIKKSVLLAGMLFVASITAEAKEVYFFGYHLPEPPTVSSDDFRRDFTELHQYQDHRTPEECASAATQSSLSLTNGFGPKTGVLTASEVKKAKVLAARVFAKAGLAVYYFKTYFKRPRPYITDDSLTPCIPKVKNSYMSYPSGHSTAGYALALALAKKFPYKKELILQQGLKIGENRLIGGVHHPSDVAAGRVLATQVVRGMYVSEVRPGL